jgi:membrane protein
VRLHKALVRDIADAFVEHNLLTYAAAIAFQGLIALVPLTLLSLGLLGATGHQDVWRHHAAPVIKGRVTHPVYHAIDYTVRRILDHGTAGVIVVGAVLSVWYLTAAMRAVIEALDKIHDVKDKRAWSERIVTAVLLGTTAGACLFGAGLLVLRGGALGWLSALLLVAVILTLILRFAPAQKPETGWATIGTGLVIVSWVIASTLFWVWVKYVADFTSPVGNMTTLLLLTSYVFVSAVIFLAGAQLDELLRKEKKA